MNEKKLRIGYTRCSTKAQDEEDKAFGRTVQMRAIGAWAGFKDVEIDEWEHDNCSGALLDRKALNHIRELVSQGRVETIFFARQDRLARDAHVAEILYKEFNGQGVELVNVAMNFEQSMYGTIMRRILDNFAELDRYQIVERTNKGRVEAVKRHGTHIYGYRVLGYRLIHSNEADQRGLPHGSLEIIDAEAEIVRHAFAIRELGYSYGAIARWLNAQGYKSKSGSRFSDNTVYSIIKNEGFYRAERVGVSAKALGLREEEYAAIKPAHPPILPPRSPDEPLLVDRIRQSPLRCADVPADPFLGKEGPQLRIIKQFHSLPRHYGLAVLRALELREEGTSFRQTALRLNQEGHKTRFGRHFRDQSVIDIERRRDVLQPLAEEAVARSESEVPPLSANEWAGAAAIAHRMAEKGLTRKRDGMSLTKIADILNAEFGTTPNGSRFYPETVKRLLATPRPAVAQIRTVAYARFTRDGLDPHNQVDAIDEWASKNDLAISEWYIDRAGAYKTASNPEITRLLADAKQGGYDRVAILRLDRICTDYEVAVETVRSLSRSVEVVLVKELDKLLCDKRKNQPARSGVARKSAA
jgi:site-specific DNA recombinase